MTIKEYISAINATYQTGNATEHSYRGFLHQLLLAHLPKHKVTNEPSRIGCGAPDYIITDRNGDLPVAFIEAKDIGDPDLDGNKQNKAQFTRYKEALENLIFTDYLDFHVYLGGEFVDSVRIGEVKGGKIVAAQESEDKFQELVINHIMVAQPQGIASSNVLAQIMAGKARMLANTIRLALQEGARELESQYQSFRDVLIHDLKEGEFADLYAQTITYGLFAARLHYMGRSSFTRLQAATLIPKTNPFLRKIFQHIAGFDLDSRLAWIVDDLATTFQHTDTTAVMGGGAHDPIIHFYEDFLAAYNSDLRKAKGVWYTPQPVVSFIVRAVDDILIRDFGLSKGLADNSRAASYHRVQILDPATGTGTFLAEVIRHIHSKFEGNRGAWQGYVEKHLIPRLYGFELLMASYAIAHLKLDMELEATGYQHRNAERLRVYLTNSLEEQHKDTGALFSVWLADEANEANAIKRDTPVMVMLGNPPYNRESQNKGAWISQLVSEYKTNVKNEANIVSLSDDYIKFIRLGQHYIARNGEGILAFITNNSYLHGVIHRGMRHQLLEAFDDIYIVDLHGDLRKREVAEDGGQDENIFNIMSGVAIAIFVKRKTRRKSAKLGQFHHYELYGRREDKLSWLQAHGFDNINWRSNIPQAPYYFFTPKDFTHQAVYNAGFKITELFRLYGTGIESQRDTIAIQPSQERIQQVVKDLIKMDVEEFRKRYSLARDSRDWTYAKAKRSVGKSVNGAYLRPVHYRTFDTRYTYYNGQAGLLAYPRHEVMKELLAGENLALVVGRQGQLVGPMPWSLAFVTNIINDKHLFYRASNSTFPLYFTASASELEACSESSISAPTCRPNFNSSELKKIEDALGEKIEPLELFDYIYAVLHAPTYREKYKEFLKIDFPRIPYPTDKKKYLGLADLGRQLREVHLMEHAQGWVLRSGFPVEGNGVVDKIRWANERVYINDTQYFTHVPKAVWEFYIGGYQPAQKWLKDRKAKRGEVPRALPFEDIEHYQRIVYALWETMRLMDEVDKAYGED